MIMTKQKLMHTLIMVRPGSRDRAEQDELVIEGGGLFRAVSEDRGARGFLSHNLFLIPKYAGMFIIVFMCYK